MKSLLLCTGIILSILNLSSQTESIIPLSPTSVDVHFPTIEKETNDIENSLLWKIDHDSLDYSSYLYGTMHIRDRRVITLFDSIGNTIDYCDQVAVEVVVNELEAMSMMNRMVMTDTTLSDLLDPSDLKRVKKILKEELGVMALFAENMKPIFLATMVQEERGKDDAIGFVVDQHIERYGNAHEKTVVGLETMDEQLSAIEHVPLQEQADMLLEQLDNLESADSLYQLMTDVYLNQRLDSLQLIYEGEEVSDAFEKRILTDRNFRMRDRILALVNEASTFTAVGALHLPGKEGLIALLREEGFEVIPFQKGQSQ